MAVAVVIAGLVLVVMVRPEVGRPPDRWLDVALMACLLAVALQLVPLPPSLRLAISPAAADLDASLRFDMSSGVARPLSIDPASTIMSLTLAVGFVLLFWCARSTFASGGVRVTTRAVTWFALVLAAVGMMQHLTAPGLMYWMWAAPRGARPFGPFINHSDFASWLVMALPLVAGYAVAGIESRTRSGSRSRNRVDVDANAIWLFVVLCLVSAALVVALSRSGLIGGAVGVIAFGWLSSGRMSRRTRTCFLFAHVLLVLVAAAYVNPRALSLRISETVASGLGARRTVWHETWPMVRDFWATGVGAGAYQRGMVVYQQSSRAFYFNHAHNEYLQLLAEGGVLLAVPAFFAVIAAISRIRARLTADRSPAFSIRAGAVAGLVAIAVQSLWETGLRIPANGMLFALLAAVAMAASPASYGSGGSGYPTYPTVPDLPDLRDRPDLPGLA